MQILGSAFLDRNRKVQNSNYEYDLFVKIHCFFDGNDSVNREHITFFSFWKWLHKNLDKVNFISIWMLFNEKNYVIFFYKMQKVIIL